MRRIRKLSFVGALVLGLIGSPGAIHAGGGGIGGGGFGGLLVAVDHASPHGHNYGYLDYFSRNVTVQQGQVITWQLIPGSEVHTVTILPGGTPFTPAGINSVVGSALNPAAPDADDGAKAAPVQHINQFTSLTCGNSPYAPATGPCPFTGGRVVNSGFLAPSPQGPVHYSVRLNSAPGVYHYICLIHGPAMSGTITVVPPGRHADTQLSINRRAATQYAWATRNTLAYQAHLHPLATTASGHTHWTVLGGAQYGRVAINEFIPSHLHTRPGDSVTWLPGGVLGGFHTVTFPDNSGVSAFNLDCETSSPPDTHPGPPRGLAGCSGLELGLTRFGFPSGPPGKPYSGGFYNSGVLVLPRPHTWAASLPRRGNFSYECLIHPGMDALVTTS